jgi:hypothetical protein
MIVEVLTGPQGGGKSQTIWANLTTLLAPMTRKSGGSVGPFRWHPGVVEVRPPVV